MLRRLTSSLGRELTSMFRNKVIVYGLVMPLAIVVVFRFFVPLSAGIELQLALTDDVPEEARRELAVFADVVLVDDEADLHERVARQSDTPGVVFRDGRLSLLIQGDEHEVILEMAEAAVALAQAALDGDPVSRPDLESYSKEHDVLEYWSGVATQTLALLGVVIGALAVGFSLMDERINGLTTALGVSPLRRGEYLFVKSLVAGLPGLLLPTLVYLLMGTPVNWLMLVLISLGGMLSGAGIGLLLGLFSNSEVQLLAYFKALAMLAFTPVVVALLPSGWHPTLWWLPTFWVGRGFGDAALGDWGSLTLNLAVALVFGLGLCLLAVGMLRNRLQKA